MKKYIIAIFILLQASTCYAWTNNQIADAIFKAEGGYRAKYLYGIVSVHYKDEAAARRICLNTIRNNRKRFLKQDKYNDYLQFLASRYCPIGCDNDIGTNKYWLKNVRYFLNKQGYTYIVKERTRQWKI